MNPEIVYVTETGINIADFSYYLGLLLVRSKGLKQTTSFTDLITGQYYMVLCGTVLLKVESTDYPEVERKSLN